MEVSQEKLTVFYRVVMFRLFASNSLLFGFKCFSKASTLMSKQNIAVNLHRTIGDGFRAGLLLLSISTLSNRSQALRIL